MLIVFRLCISYTQLSACSGNTLGRAMAGKEVIRAVQWFTKDGASKKVSAAKEITIGATLGMVTGLIWQVSFVKARATVGRGMSRLVKVGGLAWFGEEKKRVCVQGDEYLFN